MCPRLAVTPSFLPSITTGCYDGAIILKPPNSTTKRRSQEKVRKQMALSCVRLRISINMLILQKFKVGLPKFNAEQPTGFLLTSIAPECVHYYNVATGSLDIRPIRKVYGVPGIYQDLRNPDNINELEKKLADLESQAAFITNLHKALPKGTLALKRGSLELLQKFLFLMHYRHESRAVQSFQVDRPENAKARQWIECFMQMNVIQSAVEMWLYFLRYYLDTSHSDIMRGAANLVKKCGECFLEDMHHLVITYQTYVDDYFLSIWEAAEGEEFILSNALGCQKVRQIIALICTAYSCSALALLSPCTMCWCIQKYKDTKGRVHSRAVCSMRI
ncbi:uncharacterized protein EDB91DRAFT_662430 [Suillus paluster]|uniref:uncharacterized protein n=1 Tax=Suillus paluster TaxID=48578 RepID=UPI001B87BF4E|nr:uncharacterized protein EDB91DRAFT_662430 [Suillus paluster]KAG1732921.1 hypothetical protein EDB91DRAFT_662430 [Suillus paluster]